MSILFNFLSPFRAIFLFIDYVVFGLIDNVYNIFLTFAKNEVISNDAVRSFMNNIYIVAGLLAFFRLAILLINSIISPDKLFDSKNGVGNIFARVVIMLAVLVLSPSVIFPLLDEVQSHIIDNNIVQRLILSNSSDNVKKNGTVNAGKTMQKIVITTLIRPEEQYFEGSTPEEQEKKVDEFLSKKEYDDSFLNEYCGSTCKKAMKKYHQIMTESDKGYHLVRLMGYIGGESNIPDSNGDDEATFYYEYIIILTTITGGFITYMILSWAIDIAVRSVELAVLKLLSPLFIATIVDPKSTADGGYFNNFLKRFGKTYADLFIKLAIVSLVVLGVSLIQDAEIIDTVMEGVIFR